MIFDTFDLQKTKNHKFLFIKILIYKKLMFKNYYNTYPFSPITIIHTPLNISPKRQDIRRMLTRIIKCLSLFDLQNKISQKWESFC